MQARQVIEEIGVPSEDPAYEDPAHGNPAYRNGWEDGRFGPTRLFPENPNLAGWGEPQERLAYYRGHRDGRCDREMQERKHPV